MLWFTADLHFGHEAVLRFAERPWRSAVEMDDALIARINERVAPTDRLFILGDVSYLISAERAAKLVGRIACRHIHLIRGNHDAALDGLGLFESVRDYAEMNWRGQKLVLFHYPIMKWNGMYRGSWQLHGHIHSKGSGYNDENRAQGILRYDVGVDANGYRPVSFKELEAYYKGVEPAPPYRGPRGGGAEDGEAEAAGEAEEG